MNKPNFFLGNSVIVLASLVIFISALLIPANPNFEGFTLTNPQLIEKFPSSVSQSEVHEAGNKVGLTDFISALNSKNKITGMPAGLPGSCAEITDFLSECDNYAAYVTPGKSPAPTRMEYATFRWGVASPPGDHAFIEDLDPPLNLGDPGDSAWNDGTFCYWKWDASSVIVRDECNSNIFGDPGHYYIVGDYVGGGAGSGGGGPGGSGVTDFGVDLFFTKVASFDENTITSNGQLLGTLLCDDTAGCTYAEISPPQLLYTIASNGQVTFNFDAMDNHEEYPTMIITVTATGLTSGSVTADIIFNMNDVSETPSFSAQSCAIDENTISNPAMDIVSCTLSYSNNADGGYTHTTEFSEVSSSGLDGEDCFAVNSAGEIFVVLTGSCSELNYEVDPVKEYRVRALSKSGGASNNDQDEEYVDQTVTINLNDVNDAPVLTGIPDKTLSHTASLDNLIDLYTYHDDEDGSDADSTFSISSQTDPLLASCSIDSDRYVDCNYLDMTGSSHYSDISVTAIDNNGFPIGLALDTFRLTLTNTEPTITTPSISPSSPTESDSLTSSSSTSDSDGDTVTKIYDWRVGGTSIALANLPFDTKPSSSTINDYTSYDNDFTNYGATWKNSSTCGLSGSGGCIEFDGINDYLTHPLDTDFDQLTELSVCLWVNADSWTNTRMFVDNRNSGAPYMSFAFFTHLSGSQIRFEIADSLGDDQELDYATGGLATSTWMHLCGVFDNAVGLKIYKDGAQVASNSQGIGSTTMSTDNGVFIGRLGDNMHHFDGKFDGVLILNRSLSANQISSMYNSGTPNYNIIHFDETTLGETWTVNVTPSDAIEDGNDGASSGVTVGSSNNAPTTPSGSTLSPSTLKVGNTLTATGTGSTDADGDSITYYYEFRRSSASGTILQAYSTDNTYVVVQADAHDTIYVNIKANDGTDESSAETVSKAVSNTAPTIAGIDITINGQEDTDLIFGTVNFTTSASYSDADGDAFAGIRITSAPTNGDLFNSTDQLTGTGLQCDTNVLGGCSAYNLFVSSSEIASGNFKFVPDSNVNGNTVAAFGFNVHDGTEYSSGIGTSIVINLGSVNDAPVAVDDSYSVDYGATLSVSASGVLINDTDVDGDTLTITSNTNPSYYDTFNINSDGSFTYTPDSSQTSLTDSFVYTISDGNGGSDTGSVTINLAKTISMSLSSTFNETNTDPGTFNFSASGANAEYGTDNDGDTYSVILETNGSNAYLKTYVSGDLQDGSNSIPYSNLKYNHSYTTNGGGSGGTSTKTSFSTSEATVQTVTAGQIMTAIFEFFIDIPANKPAGNYTTTLYFKGEHV